MSSGKTWPILCVAAIRSGESQRQAVWNKERGRVLSSVTKMNVSVSRGYLCVLHSSPVYFMSHVPFPTVIDWIINMYKAT